MVLSLQVFDQQVTTSCGPGMAPPGWQEGCKENESSPVCMFGFMQVGFLSTPLESNLEVTVVT